MTDLTPKGLRARAEEFVTEFHEWAEGGDTNPATVANMIAMKTRLTEVLTALVAEARVDVLHEVNQLACNGLSSSLSIKGMLAMHDRHVVAEAWRAQREADVRAMCLRCREDVDLPVRRKNVRGWWHVNFSRGESWTECRASAIRAQEETP